MLNKLTKHEKKKLFYIGLFLILLLSLWIISAPDRGILALFRSKQEIARLQAENKKLEGRYANYFKVGHNAFEFVIDFGQYYPESDQAELYTRIITSPAYAKSLLKTLRESIERYEKSFKVISEK